MKLKIMRTCAGEIKLQKCGFQHDAVEDFVKSQWQSRTKALLFVVYRWIIAIIFTTAVINSMLPNKTISDWGYYYIYLTNWGIHMCMITTVLGAILVTIWHFHPEYSEKISKADEMPLAFKIYWGLHNTTLIVALIITTVYWGILHNESSVLDTTNIMTHALNAIVMFIDLLMVAYPIRLLHVLQPICLGVVYISFSVIYYLAGGVDKNGNPYIYNVLYWGEPGKAIITVIGTFTMAVVYHSIIFWVYRARLFVYKRYFGRKDVLPVNGILQTAPITGISMVYGESTYGQSNKAFTISSERLDT